MGEAEPARTPEVGAGHAANYIHQALNVYGLDNEKGRQRLAKGIATYIAVLSYAMRDNGPLPAPGYSSTEELVEWRPEEWWKELDKIRAWAGEDWRTHAWKPELLPIQRVLEALS